MIGQGTTIEHFGRTHGLDSIADEDVVDVALADVSEAVEPRLAQVEVTADHERRATRPLLCGARRELSVALRPGLVARRVHVDDPEAGGEPHAVGPAALGEPRQPQRALADDPVMPGEDRVRAAAV